MNASQNIIDSMVWYGLCCQHEAPEEFDIVEIQPHVNSHLRIFTKLFLVFI